MSTYAEFLEQKKRVAVGLGIRGADADVPAALYDWQQAIVRWALTKGRAAIFADCGLGKSYMQIAWAAAIPGRVLILAPLCVAEQTVREAAKLGIVVQYATTGVDAPDSRITITNYERLDGFDPADYAGVVLDESSILKAFDGKTRAKLIATFARTRYRLCCTATPSPNDISELANHAEFLGLVTRSEFLASWFVHDDMGEQYTSWGKSDILLETGRSFVSLASSTHGFASIQLGVCILLLTLVCVFVVWIVHDYEAVSNRVQSAANGSLSDLSNVVFVFDEGEKEDIEFRSAARMRQLHQVIALDDYRSGKVDLHGSPSSQWRIDGRELDSIIVRTLHRQALGSDRRCVDTDNRRRGLSDINDMTMACDRAAIPILGDLRHRGVLIGQSLQSFNHYVSHDDSWSMRQDHRLPGGIGNIFRGGDLGSNNPELLLHRIRLTPQGVPLQAADYSQYETEYGHEDRGVFDRRVGILFVCLTVWAGLLISIRNLNVDSWLFRRAFWTSYGILFFGLALFSAGLFGL